MSLLFQDRMHWAGTESPLTPGSAGYLHLFETDWKPLADRAWDRAYPCVWFRPTLRRSGQSRRPLPKPWVELGIDVAEGNRLLWEKDVTAEVATVTDPVIPGRIPGSRADALKAIRSFITWLKGGTASGRR